MLVSVIAAAQIINAGFFIGHSLSQEAGHRQQQQTSVNVQTQRYFTIPRPVLLQYAAKSLTYGISLQEWASLTLRHDDRYFCDGVMAYRDDRAAL